MYKYVCPNLWFDIFHFIEKHTTLNIVKNMMWFYHNLAKKKIDFYKYWANFLLGYISHML